MFGPVLAGHNVLYRNTLSRTVHLFSFFITVVSVTAMVLTVMTTATTATLTITISRTRPEQDIYRKCLVYCNLQAITHTQLFYNEHHWELAIIQRWPLLRGCFVHKLFIWDLAFISLNVSVLQPSALRLVRAFYSRVP